jgi:glycosyltransferase involved in cell wall biosynthesis
MKRIFFAIPLVYDPRGGFWTRDSGLVVLALRKMGHDAWLVALGDPAASPEGRPIVRASLRELSSAEWWQARQPDAVVLNTWSAPRYDAVRRAARAATPVVVERLDTDGARSARLFPREFIIRAWGGFWDRLPAGWRWLALPLGLARFMVHYVFLSSMDYRMVATMGRLPGLIAESSVAAERMQKMIVRSSGRNQRIGVIPHPVHEEVLRYDGATKENRIITVGRWDTVQKDFPMLRKVLQKFLQQHPGWEATVVGRNIPAESLSAASAAEDWRRRVTCHEHLSHEQLAAEYGRSKIYLMVSRYESFCIAAAEALCCGCSVVGSSEIPTSAYFAETDSGAVAAVRTPEAFAASLDAEVAAWTQGRRDPRAIASIWRERVGGETVARSILAFLHDIKNAEGAE